MMPTWRVIADLANYLVSMGELAMPARHNPGIVVPGLLAIFFLLIHALKLEIWKDIH